MFYDFQNRLGFSRGIRETTDIDTIQSMIDGCVCVEKTCVELDKQGVDYIATLRGGRKINIDAKARDKGAAKYWKQGPELALETWSVLGKKTGWTLDESKNTELVFFTFDPSETTECYLISFQLLRIAFRRNLKTWYQAYKHDRQNSGDWQSECVFVPASVVKAAINDVQTGQILQKAVDTIKLLKQIEQDANPKNWKQGKMF